MAGVCREPTEKGISGELFFGRGDELRIVDAAVGDARDGRGRLVLVSSEAGIGKTLMPARLGMDVFMFNTMAWQSLMGHVIYGLLLGAVYALVAPRLRRG